MPEIIPHPETLRRLTQRDVYFIGEYPPPNHLDDEAHPRSFEFPEELARWLHSTMPEVQWGPMGPSERSGWILGGPRFYFLAMEKAQAQQYEAHWEQQDPNDDQGRTRDAAAGFRCYVLGFEGWRIRMDACRVHRAPPPPGVTRFIAWETRAEGDLWAPMADPCANSDVDDPSHSTRDLWLRAQEIFPSLLSPSERSSSLVEVIVQRTREGIDCLISHPPELPDDLVFSKGDERGARSEWQRDFCSRFDLKEDKAHFSWCW